MCWKVDATESHGLASTTVPTIPFGRVADTKQPYRAAALHRATAHSDLWNYSCVHRPFVMLIEAADLHNKTTHMDHSTALTSLKPQRLYDTFSRRIPSIALFVWQLFTNVIEDT